MFQKLLSEIDTLEQYFSAKQGYDIKAGAAKVIIQGSKALKEPALAPKPISAADFEVIEA